MQTQKDHVQAYAFQAGRMSAALVTGEASYLEAPARRAKIGIFVGVVVSLLIVAGFFLYGLLKHHTEAATRGTAGVSTPAVPPQPIAGTGPVQLETPAPTARTQDALAGSN
jgi:hypothetical protein